MELQNSDQEFDLTGVVKMLDELLTFPVGFECPKIENSMPGNRTRAPMSCTAPTTPILVLGLNLVGTHCIICEWKHSKHIYLLVFCFR